MVVAELGLGARFAHTSRPHGQSDENIFYMFQTVTCYSHLLSINPANQTNFHTTTSQYFTRRYTYLPSRNIFNIPMGSVSQSNEVFIQGNFSEPMSAQHDYANQHDLADPERAMALYSK